MCLLCRQKRQKAQHLLDKVFDHLELVEKDYFGLQFMDMQPGEDGLVSSFLLSTCSLFINIQVYLYVCLFTSQQLALICLLADMVFPSSTAARFRHVNWFITFSLFADMVFPSTTATRFHRVNWFFTFSLFADMVFPSTTATRFHHVNWFFTFRAAHWLSGYALKKQRPCWQSKEEETKRGEVMLEIW